MPKLYRHSSDSSHGIFYDVKYPYIIELVMKDDDLSTKIWKDITVTVDANKYDIESKEILNYEYGFFNKAIFYNNKQCSGELDITVKNTIEDDFFNLEEDNTELSANKLEGNWKINGFRDYVNIKEKPLFTKNWSQEIYRNAYPIDKMINETNYGTEEEPQYVIDYTKDWNEIERFRDKYLVVRLINTNNDDSVELITNYITDNTIISKR